MTDQIFYILFLGDEIVEVNGVKITGHTHKEALAKFRRLKRGPVAITFRRRVRSRSNR